MEIFGPNPNDRARAQLKLAFKTDVCSTCGCKQNPVSALSTNEFTPMWPTVDEKNNTYDWPDLEAKHIREKGYGVFATADIRKNTLIPILGRNLSLPPDALGEPDFTNINVEHMWPQAGDKQTAIMGTQYGSPIGNKNASIAMVINEPSPFESANTIFTTAFESYFVLVVKDIKKGEQLLIPYGEEDYPIHNPHPDGYRRTGDYWLNHLRWGHSTSQWRTITKNDLPPIEFQPEITPIISNPEWIAKVKEINRSITASSPFVKYQISILGKTPITVEAPREITQEQLKLEFLSACRLDDGHMEPSQSPVSYTLTNITKQSSFQPAYNIPLSFNDIVLEKGAKKQNLSGKGLFADADGIEGNVVTTMLLPITTVRIGTIPATDSTQIPHVWHSIDENTEFNSSHDKTITSTLTSKIPTDTSFTIKRSGETTTSKLYDSIFSSLYRLQTEETITQSDWGEATTVFSYEERYQDHDVFKMVPQSKVKAHLNRPVWRVHTSDTIKSPDEDFMYVTPNTVIDGDNKIRVDWTSAIIVHPGNEKIYKHKTICILGTIQDITLIDTLDTYSVPWHLMNHSKTFANTEIIKIEHYPEFSKRQKKDRWGKLVVSKILPDECKWFWRLIRNVKKGDELTFDYGDTLTYNDRPGVGTIVNIIGTLENYRVESSNGITAILSGMTTPISISKLRLSKTTV
jgi:hypothetical protein